MSKQKLSRVDAAKFLNVSESWLRALAKRADGPKFELVKHKAWYDLAGLQAWLAKPSSASLSAPSPQSPSKVAVTQEGTLDGTAKSVDELLQVGLPGRYLVGDRIYVVYQVA